MSVDMDSSVGASGFSSTGAVKKCVEVVKGGSHTRTHMYMRAHAHAHGVSHTKNTHTMCTVLALGIIPVLLSYWHDCPAPNCLI
jgi:hypothetical protein